jgi:nucleobindin
MGFLEEFHSTPETQTDESYNHPEDLEHFGHHEKIEKAEIEKEAQFAGVSADEIIKAQLAAAEAAEAAAKAAEANPPAASGTGKLSRVLPLICWLSSS